MWVIVLTLLSFTNGILGIRSACPQNVLETCMPIEQLQSMKLPGTEEEINNLCPTILQLTNCVEQYVEDCGVNHVPVRAVRSGKLGVVKAVVEEMCNEDSDLHKALVDNIGCLKSSAEDNSETCKDVMGKTLDSYSTLAKKPVSNSLDASETPDIEYWENYMCLHPAIAITCVAVQSKKNCGLEAGDVALEIASRLEPLDDSCFEGDREDFKVVLESLDIEDEYKEGLKKLLKFN